MLANTNLHASMPLIGVWHTITRIIKSLRVTRHKCRAGLLCQSKVVLEDLWWIWIPECNAVLVRGVQYCTTVRSEWRKLFLEIYMGHQFIGVAACSIRAGRVQFTLLRSLFLWLFVPLWLPFADWQSKSSLRPTAAKAIPGRVGASFHWVERFMGGMHKVNVRFNFAFGMYIITSRALAGFSRLWARRDCADSRVPILCSYVGIQISTDLLLNGEWKDSLRAKGSKASVDASDTTPKGICIA